MFIKHLALIIYLVVEHLTLIKSITYISTDFKSKNYLALA